MKAGLDGETAAPESWPAVTVVVPVFNGEACIAACIEALLAQDYPGPAPELIVVDNGSTDSTSQILGQFLSQHEGRVRSLRVTQRGSSPARNAGILRASHKIIALTDADCVPRPDWLKELVAASISQPDASFVGGSIRALEPVNRISAFAESLFDQRRAILEDKPPYIITANLLVRRSDMLRFGLFNTAYPRGQDTELAWRAHYLHNARFAYAERAVVDHVNITTFAGLLHKGLQHGQGSARLWADFQPHHKRSVQKRLRQTKPFGDALRETWRIISRPWQARESRGCDPFYAAWFRLARHLSFVRHSLWPKPLPAPPPEQATIVMPLRQQRDGWLEQAVLSALCQTVPVAVIVVTSPATPASNRALLQNLQAAYSRLRVIERPPSAGFADAINLGFKHAATPRVGLLLSDDWLAPEAVELCLARDADIVGTGRVAYDAEEKQVLWQTGGDQARYDSLTDDQSRASYVGHFLMFRRSAFLAAGGVDPAIGLTGADDYDLIWTLLERGASVSLVPQALYHYRDHDGERLTLRRQEDQIGDLRKILTKHRVPAEEVERLVAAKSRWYGVPCHVAIKNPAWFREAAEPTSSVTTTRSTDQSHFAAAWGDDLCALVAGLGTSVADIQTLTSHATADSSRGSWKLEDAEGRVLKGRRLESVERARQISSLRGLLGDLPLAEVVACRGDALLEEWVAGPTLDSVSFDLDTAQALGDLVGRLATSGTGSPLLDPRVRSTDSLLNKLEQTLLELAAADVLSDDLCRRLLTRAQQNQPDRLESGVVHLDLQPRNVVLTATGPRVIDNELLDIGFLDSDLARTWYLWPMAAAAQTRFLKAYEKYRSPRKFLLHEVFWAIHTLACAASYLHRTGQPVGHLSQALGRLAHGELPRRWSGGNAVAPEQAGKPVRVAFICDYLAIGGQERICLNLLRSLDRSRFAPYVYAFRGGALVAEFRQLGVPLLIGSARDPLEAQANWTALDAEEKLAYRDTLAAALARDQIDAALVFAWRDAVPAAQAAGVRVLIEKLDGPALVGKIADKSGFDRVVAESATLRDEVLKRRVELGLDEERVEWVFPGIDLAEFDPARFDSGAERARLGLSETDLVVGTVSRLIPDKNIKLLVQAFARIDPADCPGKPRLLIVGPDGGALGDLQTRAHDLGISDRVTFLPATDRVAAVMAAIDVFAETSLREGLPTVILEATAMGLPILTTGVGSIPEVIEENGFLLPGFGPEGLADRLKRLLCDPKLRQGMAQRSRMLSSRFALRHSIGRYEEMILECLAEKPQRPEDYPCRVRAEPAEAGLRTGPLKVLAVVSRLKWHHIDYLIALGKRVALQVAVVSEAHSGAVANGRKWGLDIVVVDAANPEHPPHQPWQEIIRGYRPDVVHAMYYLHEELTANLRSVLDGVNVNGCRPRLVFECRDPLTTMRPVGNQRATLAERTALEAADGWIFVSEATRSYYEKLHGLNLQRALIVPHGFAERTVAPPSAKLSAVDGRLHLALVGTAAAAADECRYYGNIIRSLCRQGIVVHSHFHPEPAADALYAGLAAELSDYHAHPKLPFRDGTILSQALSVYDVLGVFHEVDAPQRNQSRTLEVCMPTKAVCGWLLGGLPIVCTPHYRGLTEWIGRFGIGLTVASVDETGGLLGRTEEIERATRACLEHRHLFTNETQATRIDGYFRSLFLGRESCL